MILVIPLFDSLLKYIFILGVSLYSYGISYMFILKNMFSILSILNTILFVFTFFRHHYFSLLWDGFIYSLLASNFCSFIIFVVTFGFLTICDLNNYIDNHDIIKIPLANMTYMTFQQLNGTYNITLNNEFENKININLYIKNVINKIFKNILNKLDFKRKDDDWEKIISKKEENKKEENKKEENKKEEDKKEEDKKEEDKKEEDKKEENKKEDTLDAIWKKVLSKKDKKEE